MAGEVATEVVFDREICIVLVSLPHPHVALDRASSPDLGARPWEAQYSSLLHHFPSGIGAVSLGLSARNRHTPSKVVWFAKSICKITSRWFSRPCIAAFRLALSRKRLRPAECRLDLNRAWPLGLGSQP